MPLRIRSSLRWRNVYPYVKVELHQWLNQSCLSNIYLFPLPANNECSEPHAICPRNQECVDTEDSYECVCKTGFEKVPYIFLKSGWDNCQSYCVSIIHVYIRLMVNAWTSMSVSSRLDGALNTLTALTQMDLTSAAVATDTRGAVTCVQVTNKCLW